MTQRREDDDDDDEDGGGGIYEDGKEVAPTLTIHPTVAGVGVLFNGTVTHAGRGVTSGMPFYQTFLAILGLRLCMYRSRTSYDQLTIHRLVAAGLRHVLVSSFSIKGSRW